MEPPIVLCIGNKAVPFFILLPAIVHILLLVLVEKSSLYTKSLPVLYGGSI